MSPFIHVMIFIGCWIAISTPLLFALGRGIRVMRRDDWRNVP